jgi:hypothetical protein
LLDTPQEALQAWLQLSVALAKGFADEFIHDAGAAASLVFCRCIKQGAGGRPKPDQEGLSFVVHTPTVSHTGIGFGQIIISFFNGLCDVHQ